MSLHLFDTRARELRELTPLRPGRVGMYVCGLTTQSPPHLGHLRAFVAYDVLRRWLQRGHGIEVELVRNVTDIDDKILRKAQESGEPWYAISYRNELETRDALETLGLLPPTYEPRATGHVPEMIELMQQLIERGHAYPAEDGSGDVYFDVRSWPDYGELTHQAIDDMAAAEDADPRGKRDPRDFALWKGAKEGEPESASWPTPWGRGRPGWHLECSAMARKYLGDSFEIHGGGVDLRFPHHENEIAQSRAAGLGFAQLWVHSAWLTMGGEKMSKSLGNTMRVSELVQTHRPLSVRYYLTAAHYRSTIEYQPGSLAEAEAAVERIEGFLQRALDGADWDEAMAQQVARVELPVDFVTALDDDLGVSGALATLHDEVRAGNTHLDNGEREEARACAERVMAMAEVLGVNPMAPHWRGGGDSGTGAAEAALDVLVQERIEARAAARAARDFATADAIRDQLTAAGIEVADTAGGARWSLARHTATAGDDA